MKKFYGIVAALYTLVAALVASSGMYLLFLSADEPQS
jgi:hypothetical protein